MQSMDRGEHEKRIGEEIRHCLVYVRDQACRGAGGRKLRQVCIYCPNYRRWEKEGENHEKSH